MIFGVGISMNNQLFKLVAATRVLMCLLMIGLGMSARSPVVAQELQPISEEDVNLQQI